MLTPSKSEIVADYLPFAERDIGLCINALGAKTFSKI
jgi:hypothetical protein